MFLFCIVSYSQRASVIVKTPGTLSKVLNDNQKKNLISLKISGPLNGTDIRLLQRMLSRRNTPDSEKGQLKQLDMENVKIVSGGEAYSSRVWGDPFDFGLLSGSSNVEAEDDIMGYEVFKECQIESIILPSTLKKIGEGAFRNSEKLSYIKIPKSVIEIGRDVFKYCQCLSSIDVDSKSNNFISIDGVLFTKDRKRLVHYPCGKIGDYIIPNGTEHIYGAFNGCTFITSITIPKSVKDEIESTYRYFDGCKFKTVNIQGTIKGVQNIPCTEKYVVNEDNPDYSTLDGVLYDKTKKKLLKFPRYCQATSTYDTEIIASEAFSDCNFLKSLSIVSPTKQIWNYAFARCRNLEAIKISSSVIEIGTDAFLGCDNLLNIYFESTIPPGHHSFGDMDGYVKPFKIRNSKCILHVPKGSKEAYQKLWPHHTIQEE